MYALEDYTQIKHVMVSLDTVSNSTTQARDRCKR